MHTHCTVDGAWIIGEEKNHLSKTYCDMYHADVFITSRLSLPSFLSRIHRPIINEHHDYLLFSLCLTDPSMNPNLVTIFFASSSENFTFVSLGILPAFCCFAHSSRIR